MPNPRDTEAPGILLYSKEATVKKYHREPDLISATQLSPSDGKLGCLCPYSHSPVQTETANSQFSEVCLPMGMLLVTSMEDRPKYAEEGTEAYKRRAEKNKKIAHSNSGRLHRNDMQGRGRGP